MNKILITTVMASFCIQSLCMEKLTIKNEELFSKFLKKSHVIVHPNEDKQEFIKMDFTPSQKNLTLISSGEKSGYYHVYDIDGKKKIVTFPIWNPDRSGMIFTSMIFSKKHELYPYIAVLNRDEKSYTATTFDVKNNRIEKEFKTFRTWPSVYRFYDGEKTKKFIVHNFDKKSFTVYDFETKETKLHEFDRSFGQSKHSSDGRYMFMCWSGSYDGFLYDIDKDVIKYFNNSFTDFASQGNIISQVENSKKLYLHYLNDDKIITLRDKDEDIPYYRFTNCGKKLMYASEDEKTFYFYDIKNGTTQEHTFETDGGVRPWIIANNQIVFTMKENIFFYDVENHSFKKMDRSYYGEPIYVDVTKTNNFFFFFSKQRKDSRNQEIFIYNLKDDKPWDLLIFKFDSKGKGNTEYKISPDQNYLIIIEDGTKNNVYVEELTVYDIQNRKKIFSSNYICLGIAARSGVHYKYLPTCQCILFAKDKKTLCLCHCPTGTYSEITWDEELKEFDCSDDGTIIFISTEKETLVLKPQVNESNGYCLIL